MFKIKGEKKKYILNIGSLIEIYDAQYRHWETFEVRTIKFDKENSDVEFWGKPQFSRQINDVPLVKESTISKFMEKNVFRIKKL